ncbi:Asp-tRNA(Asn)/Glu-tRNA(Gln) amidotransferase subunit GatB [Algoriphagus yeomjeoni]|uniref:Aspartyl/glutamyl-tRNA(Asn/Gln) amidotransferase subunit B n=1 Tax=Algoriphagus yeomjeoni TaxID=291403 RepID=A0A327PJL6_9BACT|nr:Asp-tRNA(Asn)/Glu-tRNA(Gln) amidotransferase subunit GatB [Algoriphagus yeomjeoni]RAI91561.1 aspartyl/glutamyl-tRNA(Asn/Gln) amidotransferase subunit B [Algoriphagus yeomjeoni]
MLSEELRNKYQLIIGLEVHAQLLTESKMFAADANLYGQAPNTQISAITLGHPGTLPKVNRKAIAYAIKMGLACNSEITRHNVFARKNYFYPDLPKGYQLTQDKGPICVGGTVPIQLADGRKKDVILNRVHMEEDAGKSIHLAEEADTLVDFNRAGTPLIEIVTEPDLHSPEEAYAFLAEVKKLVKYLDICDGNMEEGSLRCDANVSVMLKGATELGKKVEVKNMNSFRNVFRAIEHEHERLIGLIEAGEEVISETRTFDANTGLTASMRTKEDLNDYRYFPEPDLSPVVVSDEWLNAVKATMPVLSRDLHKKFVEEFGLPDYDASFLTESKDIALWFNELCTKTTNYKAASNWVMGPVKLSLGEQSLSKETYPITHEALATLIALVEDGKVSYTAAAQHVFPELLKNNSENPMEIAQRLNLIQESDESSLKPIVEQVLAANAAKVKEYKSGKKGLMGLFMGQVMKQSQGKADPKVATKILTELLQK